MQSRNRDGDVENRCVVSGKAGEGGVSFEVAMYAPLRVR